MTLVVGEPIVTPLNRRPYVQSQLPGGVRGIGCEGGLMSARAAVSEVKWAVSHLQDGSAANVKPHDETEGNEQLRPMWEWDWSARKTSGPPLAEAAPPPAGLESVLKWTRVREV